MKRVERLIISGKEIISVDYSGCKPAQMIEVFEEAKKIVVNGQGDFLILTNFERTFITPLFLRHAESEMLKVKHLIKRNAFIGMSLTQRMILKGFSLFIKEKTYVAFDTRQQAIDYLLSGNLFDIDQGKKVRSHQ